MKEYENTDVPNFFSDQSYFTVTLNNKNYKQSQSDSSEKNSEKGSEKILEAIKNYKYVTTAQLTEMTGIS